MSVETLKTLFGHKAWANQELFAVLAKVSREQVDPRHTCIRTLNHIVVVHDATVAAVAAFATPVVFLAREAQEARKTQLEIDRLESDRTSQGE